MKFVLSVVIALTLSSVVSAKIGSDIWSTLKIVNSLCYFPGDHSDAVSNKFFACYQKVSDEQRAIFLDCQKQAFGTVLDNHDHVDYACKHFWKLAVYSKCMEKEFADKNEDMNAAILPINECQAEVVNVQ